MKYFLLLFLLFIPLFTYAQQKPTTWADNPELNESSGSIDCDLNQDKSGVLVNTKPGCKCGHIDEKRQVKCHADKYATCGSNRYNPYSFSVCLGTIGQGCKIDADCEFGTYCRITDAGPPPVGTCEIDEGAGLEGVIGKDTRDLLPTIRGLINIIAGLIGIIMVVIFLYGSVMWITAAGNEERIEKGKHIFIWAIIGAITISIAWSITTFLISAGQNI